MASLGDRRTWRLSASGRRSCETTRSTRGCRRREALTLERVLVAEEAAEAARVQSHHEQGIRKLLPISRMRLAKGLRFLGQG